MRNAACPPARRPIRRSRWCCRGCSSCSDRHELHATFFLEAVNAERYPETLDAIRDGGHEIGCHGWRHEIFGQLPPSARPAVLDQSLAALRGTGVAVDGFRPPGGIITRFDLALLAARGIRWCSPVGSAPGIDHDVVCLPFDVAADRRVLPSHGARGAARR